MWSKHIEAVAKWPTFRRRHFQCVFLNEIYEYRLRFHWNFFLRFEFNNIPELVKIVACHPPGHKPLSESIKVSLLTHICVTRPQWVNAYGACDYDMHWLFQSWWFHGMHLMTSSNGNIFRVTGPLCGEFTGHRWIPNTKASDAGLWCFLWSASE